MVCSHAVKFRAELGFGTVEIEGDALKIIKKCRSQEVDKSEIGVFIRDIQQNKSLFSIIYFHHISRHANQVTHTIARESLNREEETYLIGVIPTYVVRFLDLRKRSERELD